MKAVAAKPISSSPGRTDKFPPPLMMRFLRSNVGSKSRNNRSRSSPIFYMRTRKNGNASSIEAATQEPSSPKVTCIGQVRVRKKKSSQSKSKTHTNSRKGPCWWLKRTLSCHRFSLKFPKPRRPFTFCKVFRKLGWFCCYKKVEEKQSSFGKGVVKATSSPESEVFDRKYEAQIQEQKADILLDSCPPKNALLLTRCRSAPYRSSSLACRFLDTSENEAEAETEGKTRHDFPEPSCENVDLLGSRTCCESEEQGKDSTESNGVPDLKGGAVQPLLLTRCKSEPARTGQRLVPDESSLWNQRR